MAFGTNKLKIVWICHFSNQNVKQKLNAKKGTDFAPWITLSLEEFKKRDDLKLHVISPHSGLFKDELYEENGINYYFIKTGVPFVRINWPRFFKYDYWTKYNDYSRKIEKIVRKIDPDIINLHGAENPYYSASILKLLDYPVLVNVQGIFSLIIAEKIKTKYDKFRSDIENKIYSTFNHFGIRADFMKEYILALNPSAKFYQQFYPIKDNFDLGMKSLRKEYDIIFFARIDKEKGIEDLIHAVSILKKKQPNIKLCIIGPGSKNYLNYLKKLINDLSIENNVIIKGVLPTQDDVHLEAAKAKISVLPTHNDTMPGTIIESMYLGIPVISYPVGGIPSLNKEENIITLVKKGDIKDLAAKISILLVDKNKLHFMGQKSRKYARKYFDNQVVTNQLIDHYFTVLGKNK